MTIERLVLQGDESAHAPPDASLVARVVEQLRAGACVVLPTETVYGFAALPENAKALHELKGREPSQPFTLHIADDHDAGMLPPRARLLADAFWPGPLTLIVDGPDGATLGFRLPDHEFTRAVIRACGGTLAMTSVNRSGDAPLASAAAIEHSFADAVELLVVDDPRGAIASTIVRVEGDDLTVVREGAIPSTTVLAAGATTILFVCTGNTCRSPLAAVIARRKIADRIGVEVDELTLHGVRVDSAGMAAGLASPASENSVLVAAEIGLDLSDHSSQPVTRELLERATHVFCLSESHAQSIAYECPEFAGRVELLDPSGGVPDPFGGDLETYRRTRDHMLAALEVRVAELFETQS